MVIQSQLLQKKKAILLNMYNAYESFNETVDSATSVLSEVEELIQEMNTVDKQLSPSEIQSFSDSYQDVWKEVILKHKELIQLIENESQSVKGQMSQMNKKNQMIDGYMDQNQSMFLDRQA
ncbi:hypothetical protein VXN63_01030 [Marinilactibacillus sp. XAAS-LB27]|uniref:hypothetical protein n=1 Tax=Marinilactibacillus sp. XAAS-LB27 TaxID=3114538 RepID=UPI002E170572|nr:hypothetical protein [Marinilactibacillus sp. XAAS-LB27]